MCKFHTSQSTHYRAFIKNIDYKQCRQILLSNERKRRPEGGKPRSPRLSSTIVGFTTCSERINTTAALSLLRLISAGVSIIAAVI